MAQTKTPTKTRSSVRKASKKGASHKTKSSSSKTSDAKQARKVGTDEVTIDRRRETGRRIDDQQNPVTDAGTLPTRLERRKKVNRRRQIDPTTCERDYTDDEVQFMNALEQYKRASGRMFPTCSEVLEVVRSLGYVRLSSSELAGREPTELTPAIEISADVMDNDESLTADE